MTKKKVVQEEHQASKPEFEKKHKEGEKLDKSIEKQEVSVEEKLKEELAQEKDKFLRLFAEFENYKKRTIKERLELYKTANEELMTVLLPILDDFDRGLTEIKKTEEKALLEGVELINNKLRTSLINKGLASIEVKKGEDFNVDVHEAITQIPAPSEDLKGKIIDVIEQGYKLGEKIIRYPKVIVGQ